MNKIKIFDLHIDLSSFCLTAGKRDITKRSELGEFFLPDQVDIPRLKKGKIKAFLANICPILATTNGFEMPKSSINETLRQIRFYRKLIKNRVFGNISTSLSIEGAYFINEEKDLKILPKLKKLGVVSIAPTWNISNALGTGASDINTKTGLTKLGIKFIVKCEELDIKVDAVHASRMTFKSIARFSKKPFFVSHTACFSICKHRRNLTDRQIRTVAKNGGIIGLCFMKDFIGKNSIEAVADHIEHLIKIAGEDHVAIGSDFDGMMFENIITGLEDVSKLPTLLDLCVKRGIPEVVIKKVAYDNARKYFNY